MKNRYFYTLVFVFTILLCLSGCDDASSDETESTEISTEASETTESRGNSQTEKSTAETTVTTFTPLQTFERITDITKTDAEKSETKYKKTTEKKIDKETSDEKNTDVSNDWFSAHTLFKISRMGEEFIEEEISEDEIWFRSSFDNEENTTTVSTDAIEASKITENKKTE